MVSKNNTQLLAKRLTEREVPHYSLRKLGIGVVSVLLGTTMYLGANNTVANADTVSASGDSGSDTPAGTTEATKNTEIQASQVTLNSNSQVASSASSAMSQQPAASSAPAQSSTGISQNLHQEVTDSSSVSNTAAKNESSLVAQNAPVVPNANNNLNKNNSDDELTDGYAEVYPITQYAWRSEFMDPGDSRQIPPIYGTRIKFEKDSNGKYKVIDLKAIADADAQEVNAIEKKSNDPYDAYFVDQYNHVITTLDPNKIDTTHKYPLYLKVVLHSQRNEILNGGGTALQPAMDQFKPAKDNQSFTQIIRFTTPSGTGDSYYLSDLGKLTYWSVFSPNEVIDKVFNNDVNNSKYNWKTLYSYRNALASPEYIKALITSGLPMITRNGQKYYLCLKSVTGAALDEGNGISSDDWDSLYQLFMNPDKLQSALNSLDTQQGPASDDQNNILAKFYTEKTPEELNDILNNEPYYAGALNSGGNTILLIPEIDNNGNVVAGKYAGRMILRYGEPDSNNEHIDLNVKYASMDPGYKGVLPSIYGYLGGGDAECSGVYVLPQTSEATITYIDDTANQKLPGGETIQGHYSDKIVFTDSPAQQIANYEKQGYKLVSNNYKADQLFNPDGTKNTFEVHFVHVAVPQTQTKTTTRTIHYVLDDGSTMHDNNGNVIPNNVQTVTYTGTSYIDKVTGKMTNAKESAPNSWIVDTANTATPTVEWEVTPKGNDKFTEVPSPTVNGYVETPTIVREETPTMPEGSSANKDIYVVYKTAPATYTTTREDKQVTRTINYLDSQTGKKVVGTPAVSQEATLYRYQIKDENGKVIGYGTLSQDGHTYQLSDAWTLDQNGWKSQTSPDLTALGYKKTPHFIDGKDASVVEAAQPSLINPSDETVNVYYDHDTTPAKPTPDKPDHGITWQDVNRTVTRTINYQDTQGNAVNGAPDGKSTYTQKANFTRTAIVDKVTGQILGYDVDGDGKVDVNFANGDYAWHSTDNTFKQVDSKSPADVGYTSVDISSVGSETVAYNTPTKTITVTYSKAAPTIYKNGTPETKSVTRTINYLDRTTGQPIPENLAKTVTQNVEFTRTPILDANGNVIAYGKVSNDGKSYILQDWTPSGDWAQVTSPDLTKNGYTAPDVKIVEEVTPGVNTGNQTVNVYYGHQIIPVTPGKPGNGLTDKNLTKTVHETVHYIGAGDQTPADKTAQLHFTGTAYYDAITKKWTDSEGHELKDQTKNIITWTAEDGHKFAVVATPKIDGYVSFVQEGYDDGNGNVAEIPNIDQNSDDVYVVVLYGKPSQPTKPDTPQPTTPQPTTPTKPNTPATSNTPNIPANPGTPTSSNTPVSPAVQPVANNTDHVISQPVNIQQHQQQAPAAQNSSALPQTGNADAVSAAAFGLMGLAVAASLGVGATKKRHE